MLNSVRAGLDHLPEGAGLQRGCNCGHDSVHLSKHGHFRGREQCVMETSELPGTKPPYRHQRSTVSAHSDWGFLHPITCSSHSSERSFSSLAAYTGMYWEHLGLVGLSGWMESPHTHSVHGCAQSGTVSRPGRLWPAQGAAHNSSVISKSLGTFGAVRGNTS
jgi:hypothetical protein